MQVRFDPFSPEWRDDPYPKYRELRDDAPVHHSEERGIYSISRYDDVMAVLKQPDIFSSRAMFTVLLNNGRDGPPPIRLGMLKFLASMVIRARINPFTFATARMLIAEDGDRHGQLRNIVNRGFTPRRIATWEPRAGEIVAECMTKLHSGAPFDVMKDLAIPLPVTVIAEMLGVSPERRNDFKEWSDLIIQELTGPNRGEPSPAFMDAIIELVSYLRTVREARQRKPADDLISLIAREQEGESALDNREVSNFVLLLLIAGNETTTNLIGNATNALLGHPEQLAFANQDLTAHLPGLIEETLRYDGPIQLLFRTATQDIEMHGVKIPKGATVAPILGSANRDERRFAEPDRFDITRTNQGHIGFGFGKHFCLGASLARLEATAALESLLARAAEFRSEGREAGARGFVPRAGTQALGLAAHGLAWLVWRLDLARGPGSSSAGRQG